MFSVSRVLILAGMLFVAAAACAREHEETIFVFQNRRVSVVVPDGLGFSSDKDDVGHMVVRVADPKEAVSVQITFLPDPEEQFTSARSRKEFMNDTFQDRVE